jgi:hypothetical protein
MSSNSSVSARSNISSGKILNPDKRSSVAPASSPRRSACKVVTLALNYLIPKRYRSSIKGHHRDASCCVKSLSFAAHGCESAQIFSTIMHTNQSQIALPHRFFAIDRGYRQRRRLIKQAVPIHRDAKSKNATRQSDAPTKPPLWIKTKAPTPRDFVPLIFLALCADRGHSCFIAMTKMRLIADNWQHKKCDAY